MIIVVIIRLGVVAGRVDQRLLYPQPITNLGWVLAAIIGFLGNEAVAQLRIRVGTEIGSAALVADGMHARTDGFTSLAVLPGVIGVLLAIRWLIHWWAC